MNPKINKSKMRTKVADLNGIPKVYCADIEDIELESEFKNEMIMLKDEIRALLRCRNNFNEAIHIFFSLNQVPIQIKEMSGFTTFIQTSLYAYGISLYGACFVKGGVKREYPMRRLLRKVEADPIHKDIMEHRHKLIGHLDENHELRTDILEWNFAIENNELIPKNPSINGNKVSFSIGDINDKWNDHIKKIVELIDIEVCGLTKKVNDLLSGIKIS